MAFSFFTAFQRALQDPEAYFSFQKEMNSKAVEQTFFNSLQGKTSFDAVILPESLESTKYEEGSRVLRVRPLDLHGFIIPEPCTYAGDLAKIKKIISMHPVAYPDNLLPFNTGNQETPPAAFHAGQIVECFFLLGPQGAGKMRGIRYRNAKFSTINNIDLTCLGGSAKGAQAAFNNRIPYVPNRDSIPQEHLAPSGVANENLVFDGKYSIPPTGKKVMDPKHIVIHYGAGSNVKSDQAYGATKTLPAGYHFGVRRSGEVIQFMEPTRRVIHATSAHFNNSAISINFENIGYERDEAPAQDDWVQGKNVHSKHEGKWQPYTEKQYEAGSKLIAWLCKTFKMDPTGNGAKGYPTIVGHDYVTVVVEKLDTRKPSAVKSDPGPAFDMDKVRKLAKTKIGSV